MTDRFVIFTRAMNTGGRRLTNPQQVQPLLDAGYADAVAYQAAGNLVVSSTQRPDEAELDMLLSDAYDFETTTFVRSLEELNLIVSKQPFTDAQIADTAGKIQVGLLAAPAANIADANALVPDDDLAVFGDREWFWLPREGISTSTLPVPQIEALIGVTTIRTLGTLSRLVKKFA